MSAALLLFLGALLSLWVRRDPKIWGPLFALSVVAGCSAGVIHGLGFIAIAALWGLWMLYRRTVMVWPLIVLLSLGIKLHFLPGFGAFPFKGAIIGLFPLALLVPLAHSGKDWRRAFYGIGWGCAGIGLLAVLALLSHTAHWHLRAPSLAYLGCNFFFTAIPEEGFFRGWIQAGLVRRWGSCIGLILTSLLFTAAHIYWAPNGAILAFVFLASLLYGGVYLASGSIESAICTHFLLNAIHRTFLC